MGLGSYVANHYDFKDLDKFEKWLGVFAHWMKLYLPVEIAAQV